MQQQVQQGNRFPERLIVSFYFSCQINSRRSLSDRADRTSCRDRHSTEQSDAPIRPVITRSRWETPTPGSSRNISTEYRNIRIRLPRRQQQQQQHHRDGRQVFCCRISYVRRSYYSTGTVRRTRTRKLLTYRCCTVATINRSFATVLRTSVVRITVPEILLPYCVRLSSVLQYLEIPLPYCVRLSSVLQYSKFCYRIVFVSRSYYRARNLVNGNLSV